MKTKSAKQLKKELKEKVGFFKVFNYDNLENSKGFGLESSRVIPKQNFEMRRRMDFPLVLDQMK